MTKLHSLQSSARLANTFSDLRRAVDDPIFFMEKFLKIDGRPLVLTSAQKELVQSFESGGTPPVFARRMDRTTAMAGYALWAALHKPDQVIVFAGEKYVQETLDVFLDGLVFNGALYGSVTEQRNRECILFSNGSRILFKSGDIETWMRGWSVNLLFCQLASYLNLKESGLIGCFSHCKYIVEPVLVSYKMNL